MQQAKKSNAETEALGRSRGGFSTKLHLVSDALGNPSAFNPSGGQRHDCSHAGPLLQACAPSAAERRRA